ANTGALIVTQGYYEVEACIQPENLATKYNFTLAFKWTAGASSPYSAQSPAWFGYRGTDTSVLGSGTASNAGCISAITPVPMYPGDLLQVMVFFSGSTTIALEPNDNATNYMTGRFSPQFTGRWIRTGS